MIQLELLGSIELTSEGGEALEGPLRHSKRVALLAYLAAARPRGFHRRDKVAAVFWPELPSDRARAALRTTLTRLRDDLGADLILGRGADEISVDPTLIRCDAVEFDAAIESARFEEAVRLHRGPFLNGVHVEGAGEELEEWIGSERSRLRDGLLRALGALSNAAEKRGDLDDALMAAQRALDVSPNDEIVARRVIAHLIAVGNRGSAMRVYDELVRRLSAEFGVEPAAETRALIVPLRERSMADKTSVPSTLPSDTGQARETNRAPVAATMSARSHRTYMVALLASVGALAVVSWIALRGNGANAMPATPLVEWQPIAFLAPGPGGSFGSRAVLDSTGDALLVFGGVKDVDHKSLVPLGAAYWRLRGFGTGSGTSWTRISPEAGPRPAPRWLFGASSNAAHDIVVIHGGALGFTSPCANDTWVLHHASGIGHAPAWNRVQIRGAPPPARASFDQVFDAGRRRLIVFAGHDCIFPNFHDTWVLAFDDSTLATGAWTRLAPDSSAGLPLGRDAYAASYDTTSGRLFVFGGRASGLPTSELWALDHANGVGGVPAWHPVHCAGEPPVIVNPAAALDLDVDRWNFFGGQDASGQVSRSVWRLHGLIRNVPGCRWEQLVVAEPTPAARSGASAAMLPRSQSVVVFGGEFRNTPLADAWVLRPARRTHER